LVEKSFKTFTKKESCDTLKNTEVIVASSVEDREKERQIESEIAEILRERFCFRFIILEGQEKRIGEQGLESRLIGTVSNCNICKP
jgi:hypothetical protein